MTIQKTKRFKTTIGSSVALFAILQALPAFAGDNPENEVIIVTANKKQERIQDIAGGIAVQSGQQLQNRTQEQLADYTNYIPGFYVNSGGTPGQARVSLRGISSVSPGAAIGTYLDETPMGSSGIWNRAGSQTLDMLPYDLDRLEVLNGPQGTLYGAGSMGGIIKYVMKPASLTKLEAKVGGSVFSIDGAGDIGTSAQGMVNFPIIEDKLGLRLSVYGKSSPGYIDNVTIGNDDVNSYEQYGGRLAINWRPVDNISVKINALSSKIKSDAISAVSFASANTLSGYDGAFVISPANPLGGQAFYYPQTFEKKVDYISSTINWYADKFDIVSATSWSKTKASFSLDNTIDSDSLLSYYGFTGSGVKFIGDTSLEKFTQELRLSSKEGKNLEWVVGAYYTHEEAENDQYNLVYDIASGQLNPYLAPYAFEAHLPTSYDEYAAFGNATYHFTEKFDVTAGLRFAKNRQKYQVFGGGLFAPFNGTKYADPTTEDVTTWMVNARYDLSPDKMVYARIATGYRPGGQNSPLPNVPEVVNSDSLTNYEVGIKSQFLDKRATFNLSAFWIDWSDIQMTATDGIYSFYANGGEAESKGFELASEYLATDNLKFGFTLAYTDTQLTSVIDGAPFMTGYQLPGVPKWSTSLTADYNFNLPNDWDGNVGGGLRWIDKQWLLAVQSLSSASPTLEADAYTVLDLNASISKGRFTYKLFAKNLGNADAYQGATIHLDALTGAANQVDVYTLQPRTIGLGVDIAF
jgi:outer membrane receptor protein involved in Fe transport